MAKRRKALPKTPRSAPDVDKTLGRTIWEGNLELDINRKQKANLKYFLCARASMKEFILIKSFTAENSKRVKKQKTKQKKRANKSDDVQIANENRIDSHQIIQKPKLKTMNEWQIRWCEISYALWKETESLFVRFNCLSVFSTENFDEKRKNMFQLMPCKKTLSCDP